MRAIFLILSFLLIEASYAQVRAYLLMDKNFPKPISGNNNYSSPLPGIKAGVFYEWEKFSLGMVFGYESFKPIREIDYLTLNNSIIRYDKYYVVKMYPILLEGRYNIAYIKNKVKLYIGGTYGARILKYNHFKVIKNYYSSNISTDLDTIYNNNVISRYSIGPKIGATMDLGDKISLMVEGSYNYIQEEQVFTRRRYVVNIEHTYSFGVGLIYKFGDKVSDRTKNEDWF
ncbi:MAG TPA: hypothetical protein VIN73_11335 [Vicingaceae bacterium]